MDLQSVSGPFHVNYHRLIGLSMLPCKVNSAGNPVEPYMVPPEQWGKFEVHHKNWNNLDCRLRNLEVVPKKWHRELGRVQWQKKSKPHWKKVAWMKQEKF